MELDEALSQISQIRQQMARTALFRGYRSATAAFSGAVAIVAAFAQDYFVPEPVKNVKGYLTVWFIAAILCVLVAALEMTFRCLKSRSALQKELTLEAAEQFVPALVAGALLTLAITLCMKDEARLFPSLWAILFSLGIFASRRVLPKQVALVGGYYMIAGLLVIARADGDGRQMMSPWVMAWIFAPGQFLAAFILYWTLERNHGRKEETVSV